MPKFEYEDFLEKNMEEVEQELFDFYARYHRPSENRAVSGAIAGNDPRGLIRANGTTSASTNPTHRSRACPPLAGIGE